MQLGTRLPFLQISQQQETSPKVQKPQPRRPNTLNLNMTKAKQQWEAEMERLNSKYNLACFSESELDSELDGGNSITMSMVMQHLYENEKWKDISEFVRLIFAKTSFLKTNLPINFSRYKWTKIFNLSIVLNRHIAYLCICIWWIYKPNNVTIDNFEIVGREGQNLLRTIKEALYIRVNNPSLNKNIGKYHLPHIWDEVDL